MNSCNYKHAYKCVCVEVCVHLPCLSVSYQLKEQEGCCTEVKDYIWECLTSQSSSEWPSAAPLSSPYLPSRRQNENTCHSYLEKGLKILTDMRNWRKKVSRSVTWDIPSLLAHFLLFVFFFRGADCLYWFPSRFDVPFPSKMLIMAVYSKLGPVDQKMFPVTEN